MLYLHIVIIIIVVRGVTEEFGGRERGNIWRPFVRDKGECKELFILLSEETKRSNTREIDNNYYFPSSPGFPNVLVNVNKHDEIKRQ